MVVGLILDGYGPEKNAPVRPLHWAVVGIVGKLWPCSVLLQWEG